MVDLMSFSFFEFQTLQTFLKIVLLDFLSRFVEVRK